MMEVLHCYKSRSGASCDVPSDFYKQQEHAQVTTYRNDPITVGGAVPSVNNYMSGWLS
ncbi:Agamous-like MADS-box protein AGL9 [Castilleja foliolosa]|uniref:Agamous-like MADS-box protein AGL9 n=1 Tax=Castilleja foliolosa TaxID=1961234 RepID=A0ABD3EN62_9LAMI